MTVGTKGLDIIQVFEGFRSAPYLCPAGIPTVGYGNTMYNDGTKVKLEDPSITIDEATEMLRHQCDTNYGKCVDDRIKSETTQNQFDAMASFTWNLGCGNFSSSTLLKKHNAGDYAGAAKEFLKWTKSGGKVLNGLVRRREAEKALYEA